MKVVRLQVLSKYQARQVEYQADTVIEVTEVEAEFLLKDAPGCFEVVETPRVEVPPEETPPVDEPPASGDASHETPPEGKAPRRPPTDKMVKDEDTEQKR